MSEVKVPEGYKQTEVGVIPEDWNLLPAKEMISFIGGYSFSSNSAQDNGIRWVKIANVGVNRVKWDAKSYLPYSFSEMYNKYLLKENDVVIALTRPILSENLKIAKLSLSDTPSLLNQRVAKLEVTSKGDTNFAYYVLQTSSFIAAMNLAMAGTDPPNIGTKALSKIQVLIPPKQEQTAIATALSDVDNLIGSLEKLIAKKEAIKTGTMQQLLTGKTRLPEFATREDGSVKGFKQTELGQIPEDWQVKSYADIFTFLSTSSNSRADLSNSGDYGYIHYGDIHTKWHIRLDLSKTSLPKISENLVTSAFVQHGDIVIADASEDYEGVGKSIEISNQSSNPVVSGLHTFLLRDKNEQLRDGFRGLINDIPVVKASIQRLATGLKVYGISKKNLMTVMIPVPHKKEQTAIATILSDMDAEIQALQQRLEKTKDIKQGMMQQLLMGKVRLV